MKEQTYEEGEQYQQFGDGNRN